MYIHQYLLTLGGLAMFGTDARCSLDPSGRGGAPGVGIGLEGRAGCCSGGDCIDD